jgi:hypothetical protein
MPDLPCDGDGVCMVCRAANPPEVDLLRCSTCATPWHSPCLSKPPALADAASWSCPDCSPDSSPAPAPAGPGNDLVTAIRAIEADQTLSDQEKARRRQALLAGSAPAAADEDDDDDDAADDALEIVGKNFSCVFCMKLPERPVTVSSHADSYHYPRLFVSSTSGHCILRLNVDFRDHRSGLSMNRVIFCITFTFSLDLPHFDLILPVQFKMSFRMFMAYIFVFIYLFIYLFIHSRDAGICFLVFSPSPVTPFVLHIYPCFLS